MAVGYETSVDVDAPVERAWAVMIDLERMPEWTASIKRVRRVRGDGAAIGSRYRVEQPKLPPATWTITDLDGEGVERRSFTWASGAPGFRSVATHSVAARTGGSRVTLDIRTSGILGRLFWPLMAGITRRYVDMEAAGLKAAAEGVSAPDVA